MDVLDLVRQGYRASRRHDPDEAALLPTMRCLHCRSTHVELRTYRRDHDHDRVSYLHCGVCHQNSEL